ncbi:MAG: hypothetical protein QM765_27350 [Myxococcales bacterium]
MEVTLAYMMLLVALVIVRPMLGLFVLILLPQPGIVGVLQEQIGLKSWAGQPACLLLGCIALAKTLHARKSTPAFWPLVWLALSGFYILVVNAVFVRDPIAASFGAVFHGGLLAAYFIAKFEDLRFWRVVFSGILTLLVLSAATYWLSDSIPWLAKLDGLSYAQHTEVVRSAESIEEVLSRSARGAGVFFNQNCWAQMAALGVVIGLGMVLKGERKTRLWGGVLFISSILGIVGAVGRSATLAAVAGIATLVGGVFMGKTAAARGLVLSVVTAICLAAIGWAQARAESDSSFVLGSADGAKWRSEQISGVIQRFDKYWLNGGIDADASTIQDAPHDIVLGYLIYFGLVPTLLAIAAILGGIRAMSRWVSGGAERLAGELRFPTSLLWVGHVIIPAFLVMMISGLGNGIAAGTPYRELFLAYVLVLPRRRKPQSVPA